MIKTGTMLVLLVAILSCKQANQTELPEGIDITDESLARVMDSIRNGFKEPEEAITIHLLGQNVKGLAVNSTVYSGEMHPSQMITSFKGVPVLIYMEGYERVFSAKPHGINSEKPLLNVCRRPIYFSVQGDSLRRLN